jgi:UDP-glucose 4-epimerase
VKELSGSHSPIHYVPYDEAYEAGFEDMPRRVPEIAKLHALIGYAPKVGLDDMIRRVIDHVRGH